MKDYILKAVGLGGDPFEFPFFDVKIEHNPLDGVTYITDGEIIYPVRMESVQIVEAP